MDLSSLHCNSKEEDFYSKYFYFSFSSMSKLLHHPFVFYNHYVLKQREDSTAAHLLEGKVVHCLLLEEDKFDEDFSVVPDSLPTESNRKIITDLYKSISSDSIKYPMEDYGAKLLNLMIRDNLYQGLKDDKKDIKITGDSKRLDKILVQKNKDYFDYLINSSRKTIIDQTIYDKCLRAVNKIRENKEVLDLIAYKQGSEFVEVINEEFFDTKDTGRDFGFKGFIDNLVIDYPKKQVRINDLKTTGKDLIKFKDSIEYYRYWIQACVYIKLVKSFLKEKDIDLKEWDIQFHFVVIDKYNSVYPFKVSEDTLIQWMKDFDDVLDKVEYHYKERKYGLPYELEHNQITI